MYFDLTVALTDLAYGSPVQQPLDLGVWHIGGGVLQQERAGQVDGGCVAEEEMTIGMNCELGHFRLDIKTCGCLNLCL